MALSNLITFEFRSTATANMLNGGGFKTGASGTDYSTGNTAHLTITDLVIGADNTTVSSALTPFDAQDVGNVLHITAGTNFTVGWYEVTAVNAAVATLDRACGTALATGGTAYLGGALNVGGSLEDDFFEEISGANATDGISVYFYNNNTTSTVTFTPSEAISITGAGGTTAPINIIGYKTTRGDNPTGNSRPTIALGANQITFGTNFNVYNLRFTTTASQGVKLGQNCQVINVKSVNSSTTAPRAAFYGDTVTDILIFNCEAISYRGYAIYLQTSTAAHVLYSYIHNSYIGFVTNSTSNLNNIIGNIFESNQNYAIYFAGNSAFNLILGNTLYGSENTTGTGVNLLAGCTDTKIINNIIYGFATGVSHGTAGQTVGYDDYNDYYNNDTDVTNWTKGGNDKAIAPAFTSVAQVTGTAGTYAGSTLTDAAANFNNVVDNQDFVYIVSGTGMTVGQYLITAHTQTTITTDLDAGENVAANVVYQVTTGRNFAIGGAI